MNQACPRCGRTIREYVPVICPWTDCPCKGKAALRRSRPLEIIDALAEEPSVRESKQAMAAVLDLKRMMEAA